MQSSIWSHGHLEIEKNVQASDWLFLASPRFHVDPSNQFGIQRRDLGKTDHLQSAFCGRKHVVNIAEPLIRGTIKINHDKGGHAVDEEVNGSYSGANRAFREKSPRIVISKSQ